jgi:hypothetical protein
LIGNLAAFISSWEAVGAAGEKEMRQNMVCGNRNAITKSQKKKKLYM